MRRALQASSGLRSTPILVASVPYFDTQHPLAGDRCDYCLPALVNRSFFPAEFARVVLGRAGLFVGSSVPSPSHGLYRESTFTGLLFRLRGLMGARKNLPRNLLAAFAAVEWLLVRIVFKARQRMSLRHRFGGQGRWTDALVVDSISSLPPLAVWIRTIDRMPCVVYDLRYGRCGLLFHSHIGLDAVCDCFGSSAVVRRWLRFLGSKDLGDLVAVGRL